MKERIIIIQTGRLGDTIISLPIAKHYHDLGHSVDWAIHEKHIAIFDYIDYVDNLIVVPKEVDIMFSVPHAYSMIDFAAYSKTIDLSIGFPGSNVDSYTNPSFLESFVHVKYHLADVDISKKRSLCFNRNFEKEDLLYSELGCDSEEYVLVHNASEDGISRFDPETEYRKIFFSPVAGYEIFDWYKVILNAKEIYCMDSSLCNFIDGVPEFFEKKKLFYPGRTTGWYMPPLRGFQEIDEKGRKQRRKRIAFTIIFNGLHHLLHNEYYKTMLENFDHWILVEGASKSVGSTYWCKEISEKYHIDGASVDGTVEFLQKLDSESDRITFVKSDGFWNGKDEQVNAAIEEVRKISNDCLLWEIDIDEQWSISEIVQAEKELIDSESKTGKFKCEYYVGKDLIVKGEWGEGPYNRLWDWKGERFSTHEPPVLEGGNGKESLLSPRFKHYSYYFQKDVEFKNDWYSGHENILHNWIEINKETDFPIHVSRLVTGPWGNTNTFIYKK